MNNFVPMNMIPFIANMKRVSDDGGNKPQPSVDPVALLHEVMLNVLEFHPNEEYGWITDSPTNYTYNIKYCLENGGYPLALLKLIDENSTKEYVFTEFEATSPSEAEVKVLCLDELNGPTYFADLGYEIDMETGDGRVYINNIRLEE